MSVIGANNNTQRSTPGIPHFPGESLGKSSRAFFASPSWASIRNCASCDYAGDGRRTPAVVAVAFGERIAEPRRVRSKAYGWVISDVEAIEILMNVRRLAEVLLRAKEEKEKSRKS